MILAFLNIVEVVKFVFEDIRTYCRGRIGVEVNVRITFKWYLALCIQQIVNKAFVMGGGDSGESPP